MAIAMIIPAVLTGFFGYLNNTMKPFLMKLVKSLFGEVKEPSVTRRVEFTVEQQGYYGGSPRDGRDKVRMQEEGNQGN